MALKTLSITVRVGEAININGPASLKLESRSGNSAKLSVMADESVRIDRPNSQAGSDLAKRGTRAPPISRSSSAGALEGTSTNNGRMSA